MPRYLVRWKMLVLYGSQECSLQRESERKRHCVAQETRYWWWREAREVGLLLPLA